MVEDLRNRMADNDEFIVMMPLYKNVPHPKDANWMPTMCPICRRRCWYNPKADELRKNGMKIKLRCTECALKES